MAPLDPFERPPQDLMLIFKQFQRASDTKLAEDFRVVDFVRDNVSSLSETFSIDLLHTQPADTNLTVLNGHVHNEMPTSYTSKMLPGLVVVPSILSATEQVWLLDRLLHRDLANDTHQTNLHKHYHIPYELCDSEALNAHVCKHPQHSHAASSFFHTDSSSSEAFRPLDPTVHKPLTIHQVLNRKLRWMTIGGQYDWTNKAYPHESPPAFPADVGALVQRFFPQMTPEAAIVNLYSPGDTLSLHRDVSEWSNQGLVSISLGCDALFVVGIRTANEGPSKYHILRLRSGDAVYMSEAARYAWHGVSSILPSTCPSYLEPWPAGMGLDEDCENFRSWRGWMGRKRINLNVRQMYPH